jgi:hypothetical protein
MQSLPDEGAWFMPPRLKAVLDWIVSLAPLPHHVETCGSLVGGWGVSSLMGYMFVYDVDTYLIFCCYKTIV